MRGQWLRKSSYSQVADHVEVLDISCQKQQEVEKILRNMKSFLCVFFFFLRCWKQQRWASDGGTLNTLQPILPLHYQPLPTSFTVFVLAVNFMLKHFNSKTSEQFFGLFNCLILQSLLCSSSEQELKPCKVLINEL